MPEFLPLLNERIKETSIVKSNESDKFSAVSTRVPVGFKILAAFQFRWFVTQGQGMISFEHVGKNVHVAELGGYVDVILDACCQNTASNDDIWHYVVKTSIVLVTLTK
ncbi:hypothetical protein RJT34_02526 [Clitoria ternatea]|uniref:Uncharacterized protein n=1 Tax=Clitoria ternatea TaxID=43366 RepID=A0AAN9KKL1_CLITE